MKDGRKLSAAATASILALRRDELEALRAAGRIRYTLIGDEIYYPVGAITEYLQMYAAVACSY